MSRCRTVYAKHYGIIIPRDFRILHIDGDKTNNRISNLLMLPKETYNALLKSYRALCYTGTDYNFRRKVLYALKDDHSCDDFVADLENFYFSMQDVFPWVASKHFENLRLLGVKANTQTFNYDEFRVK